MTMPMQFKTIEKIRKVSFKGREILESLAVILGIFLLFFYDFFMNYEDKMMRSAPKNKRKIKIIVNTMLII
jgi:hypothetical protein